MRSPFRLSVGERVFDWANVAFLTVFSLTILYPFLRTFTISVSDPVEAHRLGIHLFPRSVSFATYERLLSTGMVRWGLYNTVHRTVLGTALSVLVTSMLAYSLSKRRFPNRNFWTFLIVFTLFFGGGLIPIYLLNKSLGLLNNRWALILNPLVNPFYFIIARNYFMTVPVSLEESARIDGAGEFTVLRRIVMPLAKPVIATIALWIAVAHWNAWFDALIYMTRQNLQVLQTVLRRVLMEGRELFAHEFAQESGDQELELTPATVKAAILMITTVPIVFIYPFIPRYYVKGILIGSLKG